MTRYIKSYANTAETHAAVDEGTLGRPYVAYIEDEHRIDWNGYAPKPDYSKEYLTIEALSAGTLNVVMRAGLPEGDTGPLAYKINNEEYWHAIPSSVEDYSVTQVPVQAGDKVKFKGSANASTNLFGSYDGYENTLPMNVYGNIQSLYFEDDFSGNTTSHKAKNVFAGCTGLVDASNLVLPATALTLSNYVEMFKGCTNLIAAPELPATAMTSYCYLYMFEGCTSLTTAPVLPATTLDMYCYDGMFQGCTSLNSITCLATDISAEGCTGYWVDGVSSTGTFTKNPAMSSWTTGESGIPEGWTVVDAS